MRRRLDAELVRRGLAASRARAVEVIELGQVTVAGVPTRSAARQVGADEPIVVAAPAAPFVSRGGQKLDAALDRFALDVRGERCLDAGASTGGFTDCLLQRGAARVIALDVGRGQLDWSLRTDARVEVLERTNLRHVESLDGGPVRIAVADLSFISLVLVAPAIARLTTPDPEIVMLVKPQFEAGRKRVGRGGIVRDAAVHRDVIDEVASGLEGAGLVMTELMPSPLRGADGNVEFLAHVRKHGTAVAAAARDAVVAQAHAERDGAAPEVGA